MRGRVTLACASGIVMLCAARGVAHHSFAAEYDGSQPVTVNGTITRIEWTNPHVRFYLDVTDAAGTVTSWKFEGYPPNVLVRNGWQPDVTLKVGDALTVFGWRSRLEPAAGSAGEVTFADGHTMKAGSQAEFAVVRK